jgi:glycosyltransferase involved in cell wall biosynthesis
MSKREQAGGDGHVVSVVIPTMGRPTIELCEAALQSQTRLPDEIIIVRDEERKGIGWARNMGIARAKGDLIALTDDDVVSPPDWLERLVTAIDRYDASVVGGTFDETDPGLADIRRLHPFPADEVVDEIGYVGNGGNVMFRRSSLEACKRRDGYIYLETKTALAEDWELIWRMRMHGERFVFVPANVQHLRRVTFGKHCLHQFHRGVGIAILHRQMRNDKTGVVPHDSLLWGEIGKPHRPKFVAAFWQKAVGPFSIAAFSSKRNFFMFWLGEKFQGMGFIWGLVRSRGQSG